jgi:glutamyl-Q tRNA(Asp) synthetase
MIGSVRLDYMRKASVISSYRGRFAPSPTGDLHFGSLVAALGSYVDARANRGAFTVRNEDVDETRAVPGSIERIVATLAASGIESDEPIVRQSDRKPLYRDALQRLIDAGHAFECRCTRAEVGDAPRRACVADAPRDRPVAWRVRVPELDVAFDDRLQGRVTQNLAREVGDFVVKRSDGYFAYQLAVIVDDAEQRVTDIVRGADLLDSTPRQIWLQSLLGYETPRYLHLPLAVDAEGRKLSKQYASAPVDPDDPLPALRRAANFLRMTFDRAASTPHAMLQSIIENYDPTAMPKRASITVDASWHGRTPVESPERQ